MRPRPYPWDRPAMPTAFFHTETREFVSDDGEVGKVTTKGKRSLVRECLHVAESIGARRIFLVGPKPTEPAWLDDKPLDGWHPNGHFYELRDPCGRWMYRDGRQTEVRRIASWFGEGDYTLGQARDGLRLTHAIVNRASRGFAGVMGSPAATGQSWWAATLREHQLDEQTTDDVAALIRSTSPQHREEVFGCCFDGCDQHQTRPGWSGDLPELHYMDAAFMYAVCCRELGSHAVLLDSARLAAAHFEAYPYGRARYRVSFTVPTDWENVGLLPVKHPNGRNWHYPNRPGVAGETWCDAGELYAAYRSGWPIQILGMIRFEEGRRPLDTFADAVARERAKCGTDPVGSLAGKALRSLFIRAIGSFASTGRARSYVIPAGTTLPEGVTEWKTRENGDRVISRHHELVGNAAAFMRPELASQVWARARMKVTAQMLLVPADQLVAVWGDAVYLTKDPGWRGEDPGTFRPKGRLLTPSTRPSSIGDLLRLRSKMKG